MIANALAARSADQEIKKAEPFLAVEKVTTVAPVTKAKRARPRKVVAAVTAPVIAEPKPEEEKDLEAMAANEDESEDLELTKMSWGESSGFDQDEDEEETEPVTVELLREKMECALIILPEFDRRVKILAALLRNWSCY